MKGFEDLEYDFVGPEEHRLEVKKQVMLRWEKMRGTIPREAWPALLLDDQGSLVRQQFLDLLKRRDDQPVEFPE